MTVILRDITERAQLEKALLRNEKLASVGRMAATIAHEVNNPLAAITNLLFLARETEGLPSATREYIEMADAELSRIAHITRQSLGFYSEPNHPEPIRLNALLNSTVDLMRARIHSKHATIRRNWEGEIRIVAVPGELRQIFANLLANSLDAITAGGSIAIKVSTARDSRTAEPCVRITFADNGCGIDAAIRRQIFEPFFTTKGTIGTGLGLWVSKQLIDKHGGRIQLRSRTASPRRGTSVSITLPIRRAASLAR
jgi:signal transduction histidine kinase